MTGRKSISINESLNVKILEFRGFFLTERIDIDYTKALTLLAELGVDQLERSGIGSQAVSQFTRELGLTDEAARGLPQRWLKWRAERAEGSQLEATKESQPVQKRPESERTVRVAPKVTKTITSFCTKCQQQTELKNVEEARFKNNRNGYRGICSVCGSQMVKFGL
jgi:hypothetical protein